MGEQMHKVAMILAAIQSAANRGGRDRFIADLSADAQTIMSGAESEVEAAWLHAQFLIAEGL